jgi:hypothetical protein
MLMPSANVSVQNRSLMSPAVKPLYDFVPPALFRVVKAMRFP